MWKLPTIIETPFVRKFESRFRVFTLPGFDGIPFYDVLKFLINELKDNTIVTRAQAIAFSFFLAVFPFILFTFTLIPYLPIPNFQKNLIILLSDVLPTQSSMEFIKTNIFDVINKPRFGLLSFGFITALYLSTNGVITMTRSFDKTYDIYNRRNFLHQRWVALKLTLLLFLLFTASIIVIIVGGIFTKWLLDIFGFLDALSTFLVLGFKYIVVFFLFLYATSLIYYYGPAVKKKWKFITPGSILATFLSILISVLFSYYVKNFANYNKIYGSLGTVIILQVWFYLNSLVLLIGFELNASIYYHKGLKDSKTPKF